MKTYNLECQICKKNRIYKSRAALWLSKKNNSSCKSCSSLKRSNKSGDCSILLDGSNESHYWIGFILADGHINNSTRLQVTLALKDIDHLEKLSKYLKVKMHKSNNNCSLSIMDSFYIRTLCSTFDINSNKTIYPPNINVFNINRSNLLSLFCGFIDGDGSICNLQNRPDFNLRIKCHSSWLDILSLFSKRFLENCSTKIITTGYSLLCCGDSLVLKKLKSECILLGIPLMKRKWDIINLDFKGRNETSKERISKVKYYLLSGYNQKEISNKLNMSKTGVSLLIKRNNLK